MYYGIEVVARPVDQWGIEELREFIGRNGEWLVGLKDTKPECIDFSELERIGRDFEMVAGMLATICEDTEAADEIKRLGNETDYLHGIIDDLKQKNESHEQYIDGLEDEIASLKDQIAELEEQLANREE